MLRSPRPQARASAQSAKLWLALLCLLSLLSMQSLGQWHRLVHGNAPAAIVALHKAAPAAGTTASMLDAGFWGHQAGDAACHLLDQLGQHQLPTAGCELGLLQMGAVDVPNLQVLSAATQLLWRRGARGPPANQMV